LFCVWRRSIDKKKKVAEGRLAEQPFLSKKKTLKGKEEGAMAETAGW